MFLEIIGMLTIALGPATGVTAMATSVSSAVDYIDKQIEDFLPRELFDETDYYVQHLQFNLQDAQQLGLAKTSYSLSWSAEELGWYALHEGWILGGTDNTPQTRAELRRLIREGENRFRKMAQSSSST